MVGFFTVMSQCFFDVGLKSSSVYCSSSANLAGESKHPCNSLPYRVGWIHVGEAVVGLAMLGVYTYVRMYVSNIILCQSLVQNVDRSAQMLQCMSSVT